MEIDKKSLAEVLLLQKEQLNYQFIHKQLKGEMPSISVQNDLFLSLLIKNQDFRTQYWDSYSQDNWKELNNETFQKFYTDLFDAVSLLPMAVRNLQPLNEACVEFFYTKLFNSLFIDKSTSTAKKDFLMISQFHVKHHVRQKEIIPDLVMGYGRVDILGNFSWIDRPRVIIEFKRLLERKNKAEFTDALIQTLDYLQHFEKMQKRFIPDALSYKDHRQPGLLAITMDINGATLFFSNGEELKKPDGRKLMKPLQLRLNWYWSEIFLFIEKKGVSKFSSLREFYFLWLIIKCMAE